MGSTSSPHPPSSSSSSGASSAFWVRTAKDLFAGGLAGMASLVVCYPLDIVRTRLQTTDGSHFRGVVDCFVKTVRSEGFLALYKGMSSPLAAQALQKAIMFSTYGAAQSVNALVTAPVELVRNRLMVQYHTSAGSGPEGGVIRSQYAGPIDCCRQIIQQSGVRGMWKGMGSTLLRDGPGVGAWYSSFEAVKRGLTPEDKTDKNVGPLGLLLAGATSGVAYWVVAFPQDTIKSVMQTDKAGRYRGIIHCVRELWQEGGVLRFYRGFMMGAIRGIPGAATTFTTYSILMDAIS